jgi:hypothetical protein
LLCLPRKTIIIVIDDNDPQRDELEGIPGQLAKDGIPVIIERDSLQQRKDQFDAMILPDLRSGGATIMINGKEVSSPEEYLAIANRHEGYVK